jgi:hypothetical protein
MIDLEKLFFEEYSISAKETPMVFILGPPRTGSTLLYQIMVNFFSFFYFSNLINEFFYVHPICGAVLSNSLKVEKISYDSDYGKTSGPLGPSEASLVMRRWFGGEHPAQTNSSKIIPSEKEHIICTMSSIHSLTGMPILIKNAWNCFRIKNIIELFPNSKFIWIRRDLASSSESDLKSRIHRGSENIWNSATTSNYKEIQKRPPYEQVVLQQYEYNLAISTGLTEFASGKYTEIWYKDLCNSPKINVDNLSLFLKMPIKEADFPELRPSERKNQNKKILSFIKENKAMFGDYIGEK